MYDVMATTRVGQARRERAAREHAGDYWAPDRHRTIPGEEAIDLIPALAPLEPSEAYLFYDCQTDDARLVLTVLGEADRFGAVGANRVEVTGLVDRDGRAEGVLCVDRETGSEFEIAAESVVNATGVWADGIRPEEIHDQAEVPSISPSRGTHITVDPARLDIGRAACIVPAGEDRTIFALPWYGRPLIGTTDRDYEGDLVHVAPSEADIAYLLDAVNRFFGSDLGEADITGAYAGVRPLISTGDPHKSVDISRKAELYETSSGMLTITGGKLTTWRRMAKQVVDRLTERDGREAACRTADLPLGMSAEEGDLDPPAGMTEEDLPAGYRDLLGFRYGRAGAAVLRVAGEQPDLAAPIVPGQPDLLAEAVIAARLEQARSVADVLLRRTRLGLLVASSLRTAASVRPVAAAMGSDLGWDDARVEKEAAAWVKDAAAEGIDPAGV
jgi:glycerol-3-phosphate dehydrogenase